jgi:hypothetical protein
MKLKRSIFSAGLVAALIGFAGPSGASEIYRDKQLEALLSGAEIFASGGICVSEPEGNHGIPDFRASFPKSGDTVVRVHCDASGWNGWDEEVAAKWSIRGGRLCFDGVAAKLEDLMAQSESCWQVRAYQFGFKAIDSTGTDAWEFSIESHPKWNGLSETVAALSKIDKSPPAKETKPFPNPTLPTSVAKAQSQEDTATNTFPTKPINVRFRSSKTHPDDIAVIIGNADYKKFGKEIPNVAPAYADAEGIKRYFMKAKGVRVGNIIHLKDATGTQLISIFGNDTDHQGQLFNWTKPGVSNVYVYYAGHGAPAGKNGSTYLVPSDASARTIRLTGFKLSTLYKNLGKISAKSVTVILEACFSGASQAGLVLPRSSGISIEPKATLIPSNITVISAGALDQVASWEEDGKHSLFTKYFLMGMSGEGDKKPYGNGDGKVTHKELGKYLEGTMTYFARRYYGRDQKAQIVSGG